MHIDTPILRQQISHEDQPFIDHRYEGIRTFAPGIPVGDLLKNIRFFGKGILANLDLHREIRADIKGRINVDEFESALRFDLFTQRSVLE